MTSIVPRSAPFRVLLVQMPFFRLESPCLGLELLAAALRRAGIDADVAYLNLEFGRRIGKDAYGWVSSRSPRYLLLGDLVFAQALHGQAVGVGHLRELVTGLGRRKEAGIPEWLVDRFPDLAQAALDSLAEARAAIEWSRYALVGIGTLFNVVPALALARAIHSTPDAPRIVLGGSNCEGEMGEALHRAFPFVDYVCRGEGEDLIVQLARLVRDNAAPPDKIRGLLWRQDGGTRGCASGRATVGDGQAACLRESQPTPRASEAAAYPLDCLPVPGYDRWLERTRAMGVLQPSELRLPIETSRGCWYGERRHCTYCGFNGEAMTFRSKSPERVSDELRSLSRLGVNFLHCVDNIPNPRSFTRVLPALASLNAGCQIFWEVMPHLDRREVRLLRDAGVRWVQAGIESLSTNVLRRMNRGTTALHNVRFLKYAAQFGIGASWSLLFGFAGEDPADYRDMAQLMPSLSHLQPPFQDHQQVRVDRFSPMFIAREGIKNVRPAPAYEAAFRLDRRIIDRLAYYFEYEYVDHPDPYEYTRACAEEMDRWRGATPTAALLCFEQGSALHVVDTRSVAAVRHVVLKGIDRAILAAASDGASLSQVAASAGAPADRVEASLAGFLERRWVVRLDGRYLSLPVPVDEWIPPGVPAAMAAETVAAEFCRRMVRLRDGFYAADARIAFD
jgi:ribosomal peptide maturation radical SAM protein 1